MRTSRKVLQSYSHKIKTPRAWFGFEAFVSARQGRRVVYICQVGDLAVVGITELVDDAPLAIGPAHYTVAVQGQQVADGVVGITVAFVGIGEQFLVAQGTVGGVFFQVNIPVFGVGEAVEGIVGVLIEFDVVVGDFPPGLFDVAVGLVAKVHGKQRVAFDDDYRLLRPPGHPNCGNSAI